MVMKRNRKRPESKELIDIMRKHAEDILSSPNFLSSASNVQHGNVTVMKHSLKVAYTSLWLSKKLNLKCSERELVRGALLHDYFLYDWHDPNHVGVENLHGFFHPGVALKNAMEEFDLTIREQDIIKKHMWPLTVVPPKYLESWVVTTADKYISTLESLRLHQRHTFLDKRK